MCHSVLIQVSWYIYHIADIDFFFLSQLLVLETHIVSRIFSTSNITYDQSLVSYFHGHSVYKLSLLHSAILPDSILLLQPYHTSVCTFSVKHLRRQTWQQMLRHGTRHPTTSRLRVHTIEQMILQIMVSLL